MTLSADDLVGAQCRAVVGLGGVGLSAVLGAKLAGARQIIAVDLSDDKLAFATRLGATHTVNARSNDAVGDIRRSVCAADSWLRRRPGHLRRLVT